MHGEETYGSASVRRWGRWIGEDAPRLLLVSIAVGLAFILYHRLGCPIDPTGETSTLLWVWTRWQTAGQSTENLYLWFGLLIPLTSLVLVWLQREELRRTPVSVSWTGMMCVVLALVMHWVGVKGEHPRFSMLSLVVLLYGSIWFLRGGAVARRLVFPVGFLFFVIPLNFLNGATLRLRVVVAEVVSALLGGLGLECENRGATIFGTGDDPFLFALQANTVFLRDVLLLAMAGAVVAYLSQQTTARRSALYACLGPLYLLCLTSILVVLGLLTQLFGDGVRKVIGDGVISVLAFAAFALSSWWLAGVVRRVSFPAGLGAKGGRSEAE